MPDSCPKAGEAPKPERLTLAHVLQAALPKEKAKHPAHHWKVLHALKACRTPQLGGHTYRCQECGHEHFVPRSCGNRHCPLCQCRQAITWLESQQKLLLPVPYFHVVFTLDHALNPLIQQNQRALYGLLMSSAAQTLLEFGRNNLGATLGLSVVLHTWSQTLLDHYHAHGIVTGGGVRGQAWIDAGNRFLFPVVALGQVFRGKFLAGLEKLYGQGKLELHGQLAPLQQPHAMKRLLAKVRAKSWNVYAKRPFAGPRQVLQYLSRYTHRVALSNRRLIRLDAAEGKVLFDYQIRRGDKPPGHATMELDLQEFVRRFCLHLLPEGFVKIRHYGLLANRGRQERIATLQAKLRGAAKEDTPSPEQPPPASSPSAQGVKPQGRLICPACAKRALVWIQTTNGPGRAPPVSLASVYLRRRHDKP